MLLRRATAWIILLMLLVWPAAGRADDRVRIVAAEGLTWHLAAAELVVLGEVVVEYRDFSLSCTQLVVNTEKQILAAGGGIVFRQGDEEISAAFLRYDFATETAHFEQAFVVLEHEDLAGEAFLTGTELIRKDGNTFVTQAGLTGCDLPVPHYQLQAAEIEYYPDERIVIRRVSYYEGRRKLFTLPVVVISLKESNWETPKIGHNPEDGWYIKTTYNYFRNPAWLGSLFVDYYQLRGWGLGFRHQYELSSVLPATGWLYWYAKQNGWEGQPLSYHAAIQVTPELAPGYTGELQGEYRLSHYRERTNEEWGLTTRLAWQQAAERVSLSYQALDKNPAELFTGSVYQQELITLAYENLPRPDLRYALSTNFTTRQRVGLPPEEPSKFIQGWVSQTLPAYTLNVKAEHKYNPLVASDEQKPAWQSYTLLPEVRLTTRRLQFGRTTLPVTATVSASRIHEQPGDHTLMRAGGQLNLTRISRRIGAQAMLTTTGSLTGNYYDTNHAQVQANARISLSYAPSTNSRWMLTHNWTGRLGISPLTYDLARPTHNLEARVDYLRGNWRTYLAGGYNLLTSRPEDLTAEAVYRHSRQLYSSLQFGYALADAAWRYAKFSAAYLPDERHQLKTGLSYDFTQEIWREASLELTQSLSPLWKLETQIQWDGSYGGRLVKGRVGLTRDWHCRRYQISLDLVRQELWFELLFDLFPNERLRLGATDNAFLVDVELPEGVLAR